MQETITVGLSTVYFKICKRRIIIVSSFRRNYWDTNFDISVDFRGLYKLNKGFYFDFDKSSTDLIKKIIDNCDKISNKDKAYQEWKNRHRVVHHG